MEGWIKIHRQIQKHWVWSNAEYFKAWIAIIMFVNHEPKKVLIHGELFECDRGQSLMSLQNWVKIFGKNWTIQKVRTFFTLLENDAMICTKGMRKTTCLTVCNYDSYQELQQTNNRQTTDKQQANNTQITTNKNEKNDKNEKNEKNNKADAWILKVDEQYREIISMFVDYKKSKNQAYKNEKSFMLMANKLISMSNNNPDNAKKIVEQSMINNWAGLFELKQNNNKSYEQTAGKARKKLY